MKAVIHCISMASGWSGEFFPRVNAYLLPFLGKPLIEFYIDVCSLCGIEDILILQEDFDADMESFLGEGTNWGVRIAYATIGRGADSHTVFLFNSGFIQGDTVLFFEGLFFPLYDKRQPLVLGDLPTAGPLRLIGKTAPEPSGAPPGIRALAVDSLGAFYRVNMDLLAHHADSLVMKGYGAEKGVFFGMNDVIAKGVSIEPPFVIGNNTSINEKAEIGPQTIIGDTCIIDKGTRLTQSIVFDKTYIGVDLEVDGKIVVGQSIIDPALGVSVEFKDNYFVSRMRIGLTRRFLWRVCDILLSLLLLLWGLPFYLWFLAIGRPPSTHTAFRSRQDATKACYYPRYRRDGQWKYSWFFRLSVDKFVPLCCVLLGKMRLVGDSLWDCDREGYLFKRYKNYHAGAFTYGDSLGHTDVYECLIDDLYYGHNRSLKTDLQLILRSYVRRLIEGTPSR